MSKEEIERFVEDLKTDSELREEMASSVSGIYSVVGFAKTKNSMCRKPLFAM